MNIKDLPMEERPMEKLISKGPKVLSNAELLALVIRTGSGSESAIGLAERIMSSLDDGIRSLTTVTPEELMGIAGVGKAKASMLIAVGELSRRITASAIGKGISIDSASSAAGLFMEDLRFEKKEHFRTLLLDAKGKVIYIDEVSVGGLTMAPVHPREVFSSAVKRGACGVILVHNHPSGDPTPSMEDRSLTDRLVEAGKLMGIRVLDHIIIGDGKYYSFAGEGII